MRHRIEEYQDYIARLFPDLIRSGVPGKWGNGKILSKPVTFQVNNACNLRCVYCYEHDKGNDHMSLETARKFIDLILSGDKGFSDYINTKNSPGIVLEFIGGEPTLDIDLIDEIVDYWRHESIRLYSQWAEMYMISICSNGTLYQNPNVRRFLEKNNTHLSFSITLDGSKRMHDKCRIFPDGSGSYDLAEYAVKDWMSKGHEMGTKITLSPQNVGYAYESVENMIRLGFEEIFMNCVFEKGWTQKDATVLYWQLKKIANYLFEKDIDDDIYLSMFEENSFKPMPLDDNENWCGGDLTMLACDPKGDLYPCIRYMESSLNGHQPALKIGDVDNGLLLREEEVQRVKCMDCLTRRSQSTDECFYCPIAQGCAWCSAYNYEVFGTPNHRATYICEMHKARSLANVYFWNKYYRKHLEDKKFEMHCPKEWAVPIIGEDEYAMLKELSEGGGYN